MSLIITLTIFNIGMIIINFAVRYMDSKELDAILDLMSKFTTLAEYHDKEIASLKAKIEKLENEVGFY